MTHQLVGFAQHGGTASGRANTSNCEKRSTTPGHPRVSTMACLCFFLSPSSSPLATLVCSVFREEGQAIPFPCQLRSRSFDTHDDLMLHFLEQSKENAEQRGSNSRPNRRKGMASTEPLVLKKLRRFSRSTLVLISFSACRLHPFRAGKPRVTGVSPPSGKPAER